ncbi:MAG: SRPBCC family protein [Ramlibacter sp.]
MRNHIHSSHHFRIAAPPATAFMFFTPAGEELWVAGWQPAYLHPADGTTCEGMVFTTGAAEQFTIWHLASFDRAARRSRYVRTTPALRTGMVDIACDPAGEGASEVRVSYTLTALTAPGQASLAAFEGESFAGMIEGWRAEIESRLPQLMAASIR